MSIQLFGQFCIRRKEQLLGGFEAHKVQELFYYILLHSAKPATAELAESEADLERQYSTTFSREAAVKAGRGTWRGQITHVSSSKCRYLKNLKEMGDFISPYLEAMGVKPDVRWRMRHWLKRLMDRG